jgi:hypothetical protein
MLIVVLVIALVMTGVGFSIGATQRVKLRSSCYTLMSAVRYAFSRAVTQGTTTRLVLDFEKHTLKIEETKGRVVLNREDITGEGLKKQDEDRPDPAELEDAEKRDDFLDLSGASEPSGMGSLFGMGGLPMGIEFNEEGGLDMSGFMDQLTSGVLDEESMAGIFGNTSGYSKPRFKPLPGKRGEARELEGETVFLRVFTPHEQNPREEGRAFIYFFSNGLAEHSFIQLSDGDERIYTIEIHPLSGKSFLYNEEVEPDEELDALQEADE